MDVLIRLDRDQPPRGTLVPFPDRALRGGVGAPALPFVGWLGLLRALAEVLSETADPSDG